MNHSPNRMSLIVGILLITGGALVLIGRFLGLAGLGELWPLILILIGIGFFIGMLLGGERAAGLAVPGSILLTVGLILLVQSRFNIYATWSYAWALILSAMGAGIAISGMRSGDSLRSKRGWQLAQTGLVLFILFGAFFEFFFNYSGLVGGAGQLVWPILMIAAGGMLFILRTFRLLTNRSDLTWEQRDLFWPVIMLGFGLFWLFTIQGFFPFTDLSLVVWLWPLLLVAAGLDLIIGRRFPWLGALFAAGILAGFIWLVFNADRLQINTSVRWFENLDIGGDMFVAGSGKVSMITRDVSGYDGIRLSGQGVAQIIQDGSEGLTVQVDDNLVKYLEIEVSGRDLVIGEKSGVILEPSQPIRYIIHVKDLSRLEISGAGQVMLAALSGEKLSVEISGLGIIELEDAQLESLGVGISGEGSAQVAGAAERLDLDISGAGEFQAPDFQVQSARLSLSGAGRAELWVEESLNIDISGVGSVRYYGSPSLMQQTSGASSVVRLGEK